MSDPQFLSTIQPIAEKQHEVIGSVLAQAKLLGGSAAVAEIEFSEGFDVDVRMGEVDKVSFRRDQSLTVAIYQGQQRGVATTTDLTSAAIKAAVEKAHTIAHYCEADPAHGLPDKDRQAWQYPDLKLYTPWAIHPEQAIAQAKAAEAEGLAYDPRIINSHGASVSTTQSLFTYGDSHGFVGSYPSSAHHLSVCLLAGEDGQMEQDYDYAVARDPSHLGDFAALAKRAADKALKRLQPQKLKTGTYPVILLPEVARGFLSHLVGALSGGSLYKRMSFLVDSVGQSVLPAHLSLLEQPHLLGALGSAPFDAEGVATQTQLLIDAGVVARYVLGSYSARKLGLTTTGNAGGVHNLTVINAHKAPSLTELIETMGDGLIITHLMGSGVNLLTGDYSRGASGFLVRQGKVVHPVAEITLAGQLRDLYRNIIDIADDVDIRSNIRTGSILLKQMMVASA